MNYIPTVCVDFDGVLNQYTGWNGGHLPKPRDGAGDFLFQLRQAGYHVVILTTRDSDTIWTWLRAYEIDGLVNDVTSTKPPAFVYVDDRAVCFGGDFAVTFEAIRGFRAHWEAPA